MAKISCWLSERRFLKSFSKNQIQRDLLLEKLVSCFVPEKYAYLLALKNKGMYLDDFLHIEKSFQRKLKHELITQQGLWISYPVVDPFRRLCEELALFS